MRHSGTEHVYRWSIDYSGFADEWFELAEDKSLFREALAFARTPSEENGYEAEGIHSFLESDSDLHIQSNDVYDADEVRLELRTGQDWTDEDLEVLRGDIVDALEDQYARTVVASGLNNLGYFTDRERVVNQGLDLQYDEDGVRVLTDPEWKGGVMEKALSEEWFADSREEFRESRL